ncbi:MAG UNVERIFIED_CONTAM: YbaN family protein [Microcystis novacekii LVE1205-3]
MTPALATLELNLQTNVSNAQVLPVRKRTLLLRIAHQAKIDCQVPATGRRGAFAWASPNWLEIPHYSEKLTYALQSLPWIGEVRINPAASCAIINYQSHPGSESEQQAGNFSARSRGRFPRPLANCRSRSLRSRVQGVLGPDLLRGNLQNFLTGYEGIGKEILKAIAIASLIVGIAGVILPLLPGTPFLLLSHFCFLACS